MQLRSYTAEHEGMAERDQISAFFRGLDSGDPGHCKNIAFFVAAFQYHSEGRREHFNDGLSCGSTISLCLVSHIHHTCVSVLIKMCEFGHEIAISFVRFSALS